MTPIGTEIDIFVLQTIQAAYMAGKIRKAAEMPIDPYHISLTTIHEAPSIGSGHLFLTHFRHPTTTQLIATA